jgi:deoxycytidylate deaminase
MLRKTIVDYYMMIAKEVATKSTMHHRVGCVILDKRKFGYMSGHNRYLGDPDGDGWSIHAEVWSAIRADHFLDKPTYAFVSRANGRMSKPCQRCEAALRSIGVKEIYYSTGDGYEVM